MEGRLYVYLPHQDILGLVYRKSTSRSECSREPSTIPKTRRPKGRIRFHQCPIRGSRILPFIFSSSSSLRRHHFIINSFFFHASYVKLPQLFCLFLNLVDLLI